MPHLLLCIALAASAADLRSAPMTLEHLLSAMRRAQEDADPNPRICANGVCASCTGSVLRLVLNCTISWPGGHCSGGCVGTYCTGVCDSDPQQPVSEAM